MESVLSEMPAPLSEFDVLGIVTDWWAKTCKVEATKKRAKG